MWKRANRFEAAIQFHSPSDKWIEIVLLCFVCGALAEPHWPRKGEENIQENIMKMIFLEQALAERSKEIAASKKQHGEI
jgi:hypothetical protein